MIGKNHTIFDFNKNSSLKNWAIVDDVVMGGRSDGHFVMNEQGNAVFHGKVSLENNGGFSSVRHDFKSTDVSDYDKADDSLERRWKTISV